MFSTFVQGKVRQMNLVRCSWLDPKLHKADFFFFLGYYQVILPK